MAGLPFFRRTFRITRHQPDVPRDVADEIELHIDLRTEEWIEQGLAPAEARRRAEAAFGDRPTIERECGTIDRPIVRERRRAELVRSILGDAKHALRDLRRQPAFAAAVCLTLAVCIALNTAVFSVVHAIVIAPLPYPDSERIVAVFNNYAKAGRPRMMSTVPEYFERREQVAAFEDVALYTVSGRAVGEPGELHRTAVMSVTPSFFNVLGVAPRSGRSFTEEETRPGSGDKAVISFGVWQERFGGDPAVLGRELRIEGRPATVIGVMPEDFSFPGWDAKLWLPLVFTEEQTSHQGRYEPYFNMLARLEPGATVAQAQSQLDAWNDTLIEQVPAGYGQLIRDAGGFNSPIVGFHDDLVRHVKPWLLLLWGGALFVLLIGGISLTNLLLVRSIGRLRELATRYVLGAGRERLTRQLLTESLVLAITGGGLGVLAGAWFLRAVDVFEDYQVPRVRDVGVEPAAAAVILLVTVALMAITSALATAAVQRRDLYAVLRAGSATPGRGPLRLRGALAAAQIAVACILLIGAALMSISLLKLRAIDPGFDPDQILTGAVNLSGEGYQDPEDRVRLLDAALAELRGLPGVRAATLANQLPFDNLGEESLLTPEGMARKPGDELVSPAQTVIDPDYFQVMSIPLIAGRNFDARDDRGAPPVMIVSEEVAKRHWQSAEGALGKRVFIGVDPYVGVAPGEEAPWHMVVGVAGEIVHHDLTDPVFKGGYYLPYRQNARRFNRLAIKAEGELWDLVPLIRERLFALDPRAVLFWTMTLEESLDGSILRFRIPTRLLLAFAAVALLLASIGVYGVLAQSVAQKAREIGIRMALGSTRPQIYRWVLRGLLIFLAAGLVAGLGLALPLTGLMTHLLYQVHPANPAVFLGAGLLIGVVALAAAAIPARRAARIEPVKVLAAE